MSQTRSSGSGVWSGREVHLILRLFVISLEKLHLEVWAGVETLFIETLSRMILWWYWIIGEISSDQPQMISTIIRGNGISSDNWVTRLLWVTAGPRLGGYCPQIQNYKYKYKYTAEPRFSKVDVNLVFAQDCRFLVEFLIQEWPSSLTFSFISNCCGVCDKALAENWIWPQNWICCHNISASASLNDNDVKRLHDMTRVVKMRI